MKKARLVGCVKKDPTSPSSRKFLNLEARWSRCGMMLQRGWARDPVFVRPAAAEALVFEIHASLFLFRARACRRARLPYAMTFSNRNHGFSSSSSKLKHFTFPSIRPGRPRIAATFQNSAQNETKGCLQKRQHWLLKLFFRIDSRRI